MKMPTFLFSLLWSLPLAAAEAPATAGMQSAAEALMKLLTEAQRKDAVFPFQSDAREDFRYTPRERSGLPLDRMEPEQREAAMALLDTALSEEGRLKADQVRVLEGVLRDLEGRPEYRDPGKYYLSLFGDPGAASGWGWKFEGHHLSLNYTIVGGETLVVTPSFIGSNPGEVRLGEHQGLKVLRAEEERAKALVTLLLKEGRDEVVFSTEAPAEILTGEQRKADATKLVGIAVEDMSPAAKEALIALIQVYTGRHRAIWAEADWKKIEAAGVEKIHFGWAGGTEDGKPWYYRVQGPTFIMEAANTQNDANHVHTVWRSFDGDFGRDMLRDHYRQHEVDHGNH
ncbi:hypothetical protein HNR46_003050 [Haloferula luteola]|uniref:DUF3500 domain-containing protein n=1 Tax=Haloferula luteola TaxID=595692 RepID=A0A840V488_9BACT|nr:DUF3500 domain-containing protein [Haloferula luteola]MBB5352802.1 hypothetical protein [Haloferula luteola]